MTDLINLVDAGHNVFITGGAGVGKSYNVRKLIDHLDDDGKFYAVTAMTGAASIQLPHGRTLNSFLKCGIAHSVDDVPRILDGYSWTNDKDFLLEMVLLQVLIIDEVSMLRSDFLEMAEMLLRLGRKQAWNILKNDRDPYVGVKDKREKDFDAWFGGVQVVFSGDFMQLAPVVKRGERFIGGSEWCFNSKIWKKLDFKILYLKEVKRQDDAAFAHKLNLVRCGVVSPDTEKFFNDTANHEVDDPVILASTNKEVDAINNRRLSELGGRVYSNEAIIKGESEKYIEQIKKDVIAPEVLELKKGCQIMILKNDPDGDYVNGTLATFLKSAMTINGEVLRVKILNTGKIIDLAQAKWEIEEKTVDKETGENVYKVCASFAQFPVKLAYAITIHKSQGMTLDKLSIDLKRCFADGMGYVALSRARTYKNLRVTGFSKRIIKTNKDAFNFYINLKNQGEI